MENIKIDVGKKKCQLLLAGHRYIGIPIYQTMWTRTQFTPIFLLNFQDKYNAPKVSDFLSATSDL